MLVIATSARTGAIMSVAAASARGSTAGRRSGAGAGDQVTVTDSHHPALRMAPAASSRRQCPRDSWTCCQRPWLSRGREWPERSRIGPLCAGRLAVATLPRLGSRSRPDRAHGVGAVRVIAGILAAHAAGDPCEPGQGLGLTQDYVTFVLCHTIRRPLCPLCTFLVSDLDRPFCHPLCMTDLSSAPMHHPMSMGSSATPASRRRRA
jgi:hypothetical protein